MYKYETHLHTAPVSACAVVGVRENLEFYKSRGYDGVFITNHFLDGNIRISPQESYEKRLDFYFSDYDEALRIGAEIGINVLLGVEISYAGTDFLIYGLNKQWYYDHPEIIEMRMREKLDFIMESGGYIIHAHPYREAGYIDHIRLFPRSIHAVEVTNACRTELENKMAQIYAENYGFPTTGGTDNHIGENIKVLSGIMCDTPINCPEDYIELVKNRKLKIFLQRNIEEI